MRASPSAKKSNDYTLVVIKPFVWANYYNAATRLLFAINEEG
jgi:hypothetical protein